MTLPSYTITLKVGRKPTDKMPSQAASSMDNMTLYLNHLPRPGDYIRDGDHGTVRVDKVIFDARGGGITLEIL